MTDKSPEERTAEANARQAEAMARQAEVAAKKAEQEQAERETALALEAREAAQRQTIAEAEKAKSDNELAQASALIPDFSKIEKGVTTAKGEQAAFSALLGRIALKKAAAKVVDAMQLQEADNVLITTEADLVTTDAVYLEVVTGLDNLTRAANDLLPQSSEPRGQGTPEKARSLTASAVAGAIASAAPGLLSLFSANRTLSSFSLTADSKAAVAAVAEGLAGKSHVQIDEFRITQGGRIATKEGQLRDARSRLVQRSIELEDDKAQATRDKNSAIHDIAEWKKQLEALAEDDSGRADLEQAIEKRQRDAEAAGDAERKALVSIKLVGELIKGIDAFLAALHTIPSGGTRSPFATAILRQQLHPSDGAAAPPTFTKVLFIEATAGAVDQLLNDRPLWFKDKLHSIGSIAITYWLLDVVTSQIQASGVASGLAEIRGEIGGKLALVSKVTG